MQEDNNKKGLIPELLAGRYWTAFFWSSIFVMFSFSYKAWFIYAAVCGVLFALNKAQYIKTNHKVLGGILAASAGLMSFLFGGRQSSEQAENEANQETEKVYRKMTESTETIWTETGLEVNEHYSRQDES